MPNANIVMCKCCRISLTGDQWILRLHSLGTAGFRDLFNKAGRRGAPVVTAPALVACSGLWKNAQRCKVPALYRMSLHRMWWKYAGFFSYTTSRTVDSTDLNLVENVLLSKCQVRYAIIDLQLEIIHFKLVHRVLLLYTTTIT